MSAEIETQFLNTFIEEAIESLTSWENLCLNITSENEKETIIQLFRIAHNLKGSAASVGLAQFSSHIHKTEELLTLLKNDELQLGIDIINLFFDLQKLSVEWIHALKQDPNYFNDNLQATSDWLSKLLKNNLTNDSALNQFEIFGKNSPNIEKINKESKNSIANEKNKKISVDEYLKVSINKLDNLINYISEIVIDHNIIKEKVSSKVSPQDLKTAVSQMGKNINELQSIAFSLRMTSLDQQFQKMNRMLLIME